MAFIKVQLECGHALLFRAKTNAPAPGVPTWCSRCEKDIRVVDPEKPHPGKKEHESGEGGVTLTGNGGEGGLI